MTDKEILEKAIRKAFDNGWDYKYDSFTPENNTPEYIVEMVLDPCCAEDSVNLYNIIFNHDFAKALWGSKYFDAYKDDQAVLEEFECTNPYECDLHVGERWGIHLRQIILARNPIKYLEENM